jgi:hypothetical protein
MICCQYNVLVIHHVSPNPEIGISLLSIRLRFEITRTDGFFVLNVLFKKPSQWFTDSRAFKELELMIL